jgi:glycine cleavage system H protein
MNPKGFKFSKEHEWLYLISDETVKIGISDYAQDHLGDIVFLDLPVPGSIVEQFGKIGEIESVKAVSDLFSPVSGEVLEINQAAIDDPQLINHDPYGDGWLVKLALSNPDELETLMDSEQYDQFVSQSDK